MQDKMYRHKEATQESAEKKKPKETKVNDTISTVKPI